MDVEIFGYGGLIGLLIVIALAVVIYNVVTKREL